MTSRDDVMRWVAGYERAWRAGDVGALAGLFTQDARYRRSPYERAEIGPAAIESPQGDDALPLDGQLQSLVAGVKMKVDHVPEPVAVDRHDPVTAGEACRGGRRPRPDRGNGHAGPINGRGRLQESPPAPRRGAR